MGAVKSMCMDIEEQCWDKMADAIGECEHITEAYAKAKEIFRSEDMLGYVEEDDIEAGVDDMWGEFWSNYP